MSMSAGIDDSRHDLLWPRPSIFGVESRNAVGRRSWFSLRRHASSLSVLRSFSRDIALLRGRVFSSDRFRLYLMLLRRSRLHRGQVENVQYNTELSAFVVCGRNTILSAILTFFTVCQSIVAATLFRTYFFCRYCLFHSLAAHKIGF